LMGNFSTGAKAGGEFCPPPVVGITSVRARNQ
jgi:hypothetical protein